MRALNHTVNVCTGMKLQESTTPPELRLKAGGRASVQGVELPPLAERPLLMTVAGFSWQPTLGIANFEIRCLLSCRGRSRTCTYYMSCFLR